jgi:hypothetical protein
MVAMAVASSPAHAVPASSTPPPAPDVAIYGRNVDLLLFGVGGTFLPLAVLTLALQSKAAAPALALALTVVGMHYAATYRRAYASWDIVRAHPYVTLVAPVVLAAAAGAALRWPRGIAPLYFLAYVLWSGYHYSRQSVGIAALYPLRQGSPLDAGEKRLLALPLYASWLLSLVAFLQPGAGGRSPAHTYVRASYPGLELGRWALIAAGAVLVASALALVRLARARARRDVPLPAESYVVLAAQVVWFVGGVFDLLFAALLVPVFHSVQYLALTSWHHAKSHPGGSRVRLLAVYGVTLLAVWLGLDHGSRMLLATCGVDPTLAVATIATFVNLHHFLLDGRIWRLREQRVRESFLPAGH